MAHCQTHTRFRIESRIDRRLGQPGPTLRRDRLIDTVLVWGDECTGLYISCPSKIIVLPKYTFKTVVKVRMEVEYVAHLEVGTIQEAITEYCNVLRRFDVNSMDALKPDITLNVTMIDFSLMCRVLFPVGTNKAQTAPMVPMTNREENKTNAPNWRTMVTSVRESTQVTRPIWGN